MFVGIMVLNYQKKRIIFTSVTSRRGHKSKIKSVKTFNANARGNMNCNGAFLTGSPMRLSADS